MLIQIFYDYYGKRVIILLDEYDVPLEHSYFSNFYPQILTFIRNLFESALKTNDNLEFAILTGCLRVSKESIFTGLNNLTTYSILNDLYSEYFGFTEDEVNHMVQYFSENINELKEWYNGYQFGRCRIYNPWSVLQAVKAYINNSNSLPIAYWANTSSNSIIRTLIDKADSTTKSEIELLMDGRSLIKQINEDITYADLECSSNNLWNFLYYTGYLISRRTWAENSGDIFAELIIPNKEVQYIFRNKMIQWFSENLTSDRLPQYYKVSS